MMDPQLSKALLPVAARYRHRRLVLLLTSSWLLLGILLAVIYFRPPSWVLPPLGLVSAAGLIAILLVAACWILAHRTARDPLYVAGQIESAFPDLDALLLTAVDQTTDRSSGTFTFLQLRVIHRALEHARGTAGEISSPRPSSGWGTHCTPWRLSGYSVLPVSG